MTYPVHPAAMIFPMMADDALQGLAADIKAHGQQEPIELLDGAVLDGRNRLAACELVEVAPTFRVLTDIDSPTTYVLSKNLHRRHLLVSQRGMIGDRATEQFEIEAKERQRLHGNTAPGRSSEATLEANLPQVLDDPVAEQPAPKPTKQPKERAPQSRERAAKAVGVSGRTVATARRVRLAAPELAARVERGEITLNQATGVIRREERAAQQAALPPPPEIHERIEVANVAQHIPLDDDSIDLIVTSPPYALDVAYDEGDIVASDWPEFMTDWLAEAYRVARTNGGRLALNVPLDTCEPSYRPVYAEMVTAALGAGWTYRTTVVWDEGNSTKGNRGLGSVDSASAPHPIAPVEMVALFSKGAWGKPAQGVSDISHEEWQELGNGLWKFSGESRAWEDHPAAFPKELPRRLIQYLSYVGDTVLDPFCGSGTTILVAKSLKRAGLGFDISAKYVASAKRRIGAMV